MAVTLLVAFAVFMVSVISLNLEPPEFLGPYTDDPIRWPYGGCVEVTKIYPAPGSHLPPPFNKRAQNWNLTITVVFSRPVTRILWNFNTFIKLKLRNRYDSRVICERKACLYLKMGRTFVFYTPTVSGPTRRGTVFSDEYQFTFTLPVYVKDFPSEIFFEMDGGWMYSPVYKFITNADVEYVPYVAVRYLPPHSEHSTKSRPPERDTNYWVNYPSTCAVRGGLIHRPSIFSRTARKKEATTDHPKLLTELSEVVDIHAKGKFTLKLHYQVKQPGLHTIQLPDIIKAMDKETNLSALFSVPTVVSLVINFTTPRLYIPVKTLYRFDSRERDYYMDHKWTANFFTWKNDVCNSDSTSFACNKFLYSGTFPNQSQHGHQFDSLNYHGGYKPEDLIKFGLTTQYYHTLRHMGDNDKQYPFSIPATLQGTHTFASQYIKCLRSNSESSCHKNVLVIDPYWRLMVIKPKNTPPLLSDELDVFMESDELKITIFRSRTGINGNGVPSTMQYSATGSYYAKNMTNIIPFANFDTKFADVKLSYIKRRLISTCKGHAKRNVGKWGKLQPYIERGNVYRSHVPKPSSYWTIQQTVNVNYTDKYGQQGIFNATIVSFPEHIKKAVEKYAVLTNMEPNVYTGAQRDARLRPARESYPLEKAVFVPRELVNKHGCGTLNISHNDVLQMHNYYDSVYGKRKREFFCSRPPGNCTGLPYDSLDRFPVIPPFNVFDLVGSVDHTDPDKTRYKRALYYRDNMINDDLFILYAPNSPYTVAVEIEAEVKEPVFVEKSCNEFWEFSPDKYEITKGYLTATITNKGEGGSDVELTAQCSPKLTIEKAKVWVDPYQTKKAQIVVHGYLAETSTDGYNCETFVTVHVKLFSSIAGKTFPICNIFIPTFNGSFVNPCDNYLGHDIIYHHLPKEFAHDASLKTFTSSPIGGNYELLKIISVELVKYHMIQLSCENKDVLALAEDQLITSSLEKRNLIGKNIDLIYTTDNMVKRRIYILIKKHGNKDAATKCLLTLISSPYTPCGVSSRKYITVTEADVPVAMTLEKEEAVRKAAKIKKSIWNTWISDREEVVSAVLVCTMTSVVLIVLMVTSNSGLLIYSKLSSSKKKIEQIRTELRIAKQDHKKTWNNPQMYLKRGILGPHYVLHKFKATGTLDTGNLKVLKIAGMLKYKEKELKVIFGHVKKIIIRKTPQGKAPDQVWLQASSGMYLLKQKHVSKEYEAEFNSLLKRRHKEDI